MIHLIVCCPISQNLFVIALVRPPFLKGGGSAGVGGLDYLDTKDEHQLHTKTIEMIKYSAFTAKISTK